MLKLKNLNESLTKKYNTASEKHLNEAFNDSFPSWLKARLSELSKYHGTDKDGRGNRDPFGIDVSKRPEYTRPRGFYGPDKELNLLNKLLKETDMDTLEVIEGPVPVKRTDSRLKPPNIPIFHFPNGQVYIQGLNDTELFKDSSYRAKNGNSVAFKYVPLKYLLSGADAFAYIDEDNIAPSNYEEKRLERKNAANELKNMNYGRSNKDPDAFVKTPGYGYDLPRDKREYLDKSGYVADPGKYIKKLEDIRADDYGKVLQERHDKLIELRDDLVAALSYYDPIEDRDVYSNLSTIMANLGRAIDNFNSHSRDIESYANNSSYDKDLIRRLIKSEVKNMLNDVYFSRAVEEGEKIFLGNADWLV